MHKLLGKAQKLEPVQVWGESFFVRRLSGLARELIQIERDKDRPRHSWRALTVRHSLVDKDGVFVFSDTDLDDLDQEPANELDKVCRIANTIIEITPEEVAELKKRLAILTETSSGDTVSPSVAP
jgi:hypothetical protein